MRWHGCALFSGKVAFCAFVQVCESVDRDVQNLITQYAEVKHSQGYCIIVSMAGFRCLVLHYCSSKKLQVSLFERLFCSKHSPHRNDNHIQPRARMFPLAIWFCTTLSSSAGVCWEMRDARPGVRILGKALSPYSPAQCTNCATTQTNYVAAIAGIFVFSFTVRGERDQQLQPCRKAKSHS